MAYSITNPPVLVTQAMTSTIPRLWFLTGTDAASVAQVTGYITDGGALGMKVDDLVFYYDTTSHITNSMLVDAVSTTYPGAIDLTNATSIGTTTTSD